MNFIEFVKSDLRNLWIYENGIEIYVRKPTKYSNYYDLANMSAQIQGEGSLTHFLNSYEPMYNFRVENIHNPRLVSYLCKRGYEIQGCDKYVTTMTRLKTYTIQ